MNNLGWECPRCHKIHAPHIDSCDCDGLKTAPIVPLIPPMPFPYSPYIVPPPEPDNPLQPPPYRWDKSITRPNTATGWQPPGGWTIWYKQ